MKYHSIIQQSINKENPPYYKTEMTKIHLPDKDVYSPIGLPKSSICGVLQSRSDLAGVEG